jgi:hypothetical protein
MANETREINQKLKLDWVFWWNVFWDEVVECLAQQKLVILPDSFFKHLSSEEEKEFRQWTRENYDSYDREEFELFHPVVRDEIAKIDREYKNGTN